MFKPLKMISSEQEKKQEQQKERQHKKKSYNMHTEIESAVNFLTNALSNSLNLGEESLIILRKRITELLQKRFENHWYPEKPMKGSAYRCMNISIDDGSVDLVLLKAGQEVGITKQDLISVFSKGLALWVDPNDVSCRIGKGAIFPISRKIADPRPVSSYVQANQHRRPQQRPRSMSPPTFQNLASHQQQQRPRSTTPPGFGSLDTTQSYQTMQNKNYSLDNLHKLWDTIPNTSTYVPSTKHQGTTLYSSAGTTSYSGQSDAVYSFNQYSSYYAPGSLWKKNLPKNHSVLTKQQTKCWKEDNTYNKYHWSRNERANTNTISTMYNGYSNLSYGYPTSTRYAQEVC